MSWTNTTGIDYIDIFISGYSQNIFGDQILAFFTFGFVVMLAFVVAKAPRETIMLVPAVALIGLSELFGQLWMKVMVYLVAGLYLFWLWPNLISMKEK